MDARYAPISVRIELNVGSIILSTGLKPFDPAGFDTYQYSKFSNVVTSLEFERLLSAGGPTGGHVLRPSDMKEPAKIAWFQCIGSRDVNRCDNEYCSSVCCMYALKEAVIAKEHLGKDFEPAIFFMDIRTHGKDFEKYYERAKSEGVRFIRSRVHTITEADETGTLNLRYVTESGEVISEDFDMVVLSIGMEPADSAIDAAKKLGVELNRYNFVKTENILPVAASRQGIYVAGVIQGCQDIPESVMQASAAACNAGISLASARGTLVKDKEFPEESDVSGQESRLGVFVCNCGVNIGGIADVPAIAEYTKSLPGVVYVEENLFSCSQDTQQNMVEVIKAQHLNRIVVAACTPRTHEPLFQETVRNAGLNPYLFEMANIRNQCTWVHSGEKEKVTEKCKDLVKMSIDRASLLEPIPEISVQVNRSGLIIGGGVAGITAALSLADQGFPATIIEKSPVLGGAARDVMKTWGGSDVQEYLSGLIDKVETHPHIEVFLNAKVVGASGFVGNFETEISFNNVKKTITHGVAIVATGGQASDTDEYLYGKNPRVNTFMEKIPE
jgi:heterodisulfide reductase subunit A